MAARLIFMEGVSGVGKTTLSAALFEGLRGLGHPARCFLEGDPESPLDLFQTAYLTRARYEELLRAHPDWADELRKRSMSEADYALIRYRNAAEEARFPDVLYQLLKEREFCYHPSNPLPLPEYANVFLRLWKRFVSAGTRAEGAFIFDGSLLHHQINDLMRNYNASRAQIAAHVGALAQTVAALDPVVFYLSAGDVVEQLTRARLNRGQTPPTAEQAAFWQRRKEIDLWTLGSLPIESHVIEIDDCGYDAARAAITAHCRRK
jgi:hypothetical protein